MSRKLFLLILTIIILIASCKKDPISVPIIEKKDQILPLAVGNKWEYTVDYNYGTTDTIIWEVFNSIKINTEEINSEVFCVNYYHKGSVLPDYYWLFANDVDGLHTFGGISNVDTLLAKNLRLKFPSTQVDSYQVFDIRYSYNDEIFLIKDTLTFSLVSLNDTLTTPAGVFNNCYVYKYKIKPADDVVCKDVYYNYYVPNVGLIGTIVASDCDNRVKTKILLFDYKLY